jgi:hypothetical protein
MPRMEVLDCGTSQVLGTSSTGHGKQCRTRPWRIFSILYCVCSCHRRKRRR